MKSVLAALIAAGCSSPAGDGTPTFQTEPLVTQASDSGAYDVELYAPSDGFVRGLDSMKAVITRAGAPALGLNVAVVPWMPAMGHGASGAPDVTEVGGGVYVVTNLALFMSGTWQLRTTLGQDNVLFTVEVP